MASFLDIGILGFFSAIFTFILVFVIIYGLLTLIHPLGDKKNGLYAIIALAFAVLAIVNPVVMHLITFMTPWFFVAIFVGFFILFILFMFGLKPEKLTAGESSEFRTWPIIIAIVLLLFGLGSALGQSTLEQGGTTPTTTVNVPSNTSNSAPLSDNPLATKTATGDPENTGTGDYESNVLNTIVNPGVLGLALMLLVAVFTIFFLTKESLDP